MRLWDLGLEPDGSAGLGASLLWGGGLFGGLGEEADGGEGAGEGFLGVALQPAVDDFAVDAAEVDVEGEVLVFLDLQAWGLAVEAGL